MKDRKEANKYSEEELSRRFTHMMEQTGPTKLQRESVWEKITGKETKRHPVVRAALVAACTFAIFLVGTMGVNAATDGALLESVKEFCGLSEKQQEVAKETLAMPQEVYAPVLAAVSEEYLVFANERGLMVYDRTIEALTAVLDLQELECNYFNADTMRTCVYVEDHRLCFFNRKWDVESGEEIPGSYTSAYVYDLSLAGQEEALRKTEEPSELAAVRRGWERYEADCIRDTFDEMQNRPMDINELFATGRIAYSENCICWTDAAGVKQLSFLVVTRDNVYILYTRPEDSMELAEDTLAIETEEPDGEQALPEFHYSGEDEIMAALCEEARLEEEKYYYNEENYVFIPAPQIFAVVEDGDDRLVFCMFSIYGYYRNGNTLNCDSGGRGPARIRLTPGENGAYTVTEHIHAQDGGGYMESIEEFCEPYSVSPDIFNYTETFEADDKQLRKEMIQMYAKDNGLDIKYYKDYGWDPVPVWE
ncbi:MAG: hypothetical protein NC180_07340 [Muribaculaceae bacterium]|nr:hypothetical protein [Roseburia sp.]MCM1429955.1 hypothetical protein [Muribaculaceae bacterium]MCM1493018.1 hypothetical protein [Muribaculaceae bacterium]